MISNVFSNSAPEILKLLNTLSKGNILYKCCSNMTPGAQSVLNPPILSIVKSAKVKF